MNPSGSGRRVELAGFDEDVLFLEDVPWAADETETPVLDVLEYLVAENERLDEAEVCATTVSCSCSSQTAKHRLVIIISCCNPSL